MSIIIPVYNAGRYLEACIQSALGQTWRHKEIIIVDDGSTDDSLQIARRFEGQLVKVMSRENAGASAARNAGLRAASGEYIQFLDADDLLSPEKIEAQVTLLDGSQTRLAICRTAHFADGESMPGDADGDSWLYSDNDNPLDFLTKLYAGDEVLPGHGGLVTIHSWLTPRKLIDKAGPWNESLSLDDDGEFFCRVVLASDGVKYSSTGINYYRKFDNKQSLSAQKNKQHLESAVLSNDLKYGHLKARTNDSIIDRIFAKHYWWTGVLAYPEFKGLSNYCIQKAKLLGYKGEKFVGGPSGHLLAGVFGWKAARLISHYRQKINSTWG